MRTHVPLAMVFAAVALYGEPIELGCNARGPLAALRSSATFLKAIGDANPANYLGSVYDASGQRLSSGTYKALRCPLFIDSTATPSAAASKAILRAEVGIRVARSEEQAIAVAGVKPLAVYSAAGVVVELPPSLMKQSGPEQRPQEAAKPQERASGRQVETASTAPTLGNETAQAKANAPRESALPPSVQAAPPDDPVQEERVEASTANASQVGVALTLGQAFRLVRRVETRDGETTYELDPAVALVHFLALFGMILAFGLLIVHPGRPVENIRTRMDIYREVLKSVEFQTQQSAPVRSQQMRIVSGQESALLFPVGR